MSETRTYTPSNPLNDPDQIAICTARMYWLALVLTDREDLAAELTRKGAELLVAGLGSSPFNGSWEAGVCRTMIEACIHALHVHLQADQREVAAWDDDRDALFDSLDVVKNLSRSSIESAIRSLPVLPRFMFVIRTLNGYTAQRASEMLLIPQAICEAAGTYALVTLTKTVQSWNSVRAPTSSGFPRWGGVRQASTREQMGVQTAAGSLDRG